MLATLASYMGFQKAAVYIPFFSQNVVPHIIAGEVALIVPGALYFIIKRIKWTEFMEFHEPSGFSLRMAFCALLCSFPIVVILNFISMHFVRNQVTDVLPHVLSLGLIPSLLIMALLPAFVEEFVFRGIMYHAYRQYSKTGGILLSALLFGLMHLNLNQAVYAFFLGIILAIMVEATGSLHTSMFMHFLFNGSSVALNYFAGGASLDPEKIQAATKVMLEMRYSVKDIIAILIAVILMFLLLFLVIRKTFRKNERTLVSGGARGSGRKLIDVWILLFIVAAIALTVKNTVFI